MSSNASNPGHYPLASGADAVGRLNVLQKICAPEGRVAILEAGLTAGMKVADFGCGTGNMTRMLAAMAGPKGHVTGVDFSGAQLEQARTLSAAEGLTNTTYVEADACKTGLPRNTFDLAYCRFLLLHLTDPAACINEMRDVLKPGGILIVEDGDILAAGSAPRTSLDAFADLFGKLGPVRGVDYSIANRLCHMVSDAGFSQIGMRVHHPCGRAGAVGLLMRWSIEEVGPALVMEGLITPEKLKRTLDEMQRAAEDPNVLAFGPRMSQVWGRKTVS